MFLWAFTHSMGLIAILFAFVVLLFLMLYYVKEMNKIDKEDHDDFLNP